MILKRMKRRHSRNQVLEICNRLRNQRPEITLGADLIAGFPTETEKMFKNTLTLIHEAGLSHLHVFPYSTRSGTPAERMPQVPIIERKKRASLLRNAGLIQLRKLLNTGIGSKVTVLMEQNGMGHCERFLPVRMQNNFASGSLIRAKIQARSGNVWIAAKTA